MTEYDLVSIDPGRSHVAVAAWRNSKLAKCALLEVEGGKDLGITVSRLLELVDIAAETAVVEYMCHHPGRAASHPRDLIDVSIAGSALAGKMAHTIFFVPATAWKGQTPKAIMQRRIVTRLTETEMALLADCLLCIRRSRHHDIYDAVGIGLHHLGRL